MIDIVNDPIGAPLRPETIVHPDVVFVLDESGSMQPHQSAVVSTFNEYVADVKETAKSISLYTFDSTGIREKLFKESPARVKRLSERDYVPNAMTPLYDAIGAVISKFQFNSRPVQMIIHTDGQENASTEYTKAKLDELIAHQQAQHRWLFTYLMEGLEGKAALEGFSGLKMSFSPGMRGQTMKTVANATAMYASTMDANPRAYTLTGSDEIDVDEGEGLKSADAPQGGTT